MTERDQPEDRDYPDGSVGRYVREKWGSAPARPARAARPYVPPVEPPSLRPAPYAETDHAEAENDDRWAYQPESPWPHGADPRREATETDHTQIDPARAASSHDPFEGVEYGSATWGAARAEEERAANDAAARNGEVEPGPPRRRRAWAAVAPGESPNRPVPVPRRATATRQPIPPTRAATTRVAPRGPQQPPARAATAAAPRTPHQRAASPAAPRTRRDPAATPAPPPTR